MRTYAQLQEELGTLVGLPQNLPTIYLLGDTGAGKTCLVRQLLGTTGERFPSVKRHRTTVAPTEFIITNERIFRAGFVMRPESEVEQFVDEILEMTVHRAFNAARAPDDSNISALTDLLANSPDERFRLRCFLNEAERRDIATEIFSEIAPALLAWSEHEFPDDKDNPTVVELGIKENSDIKDEFERVRKRILDCIAKQLKEACGCRSDATYPRTFTFESHNRTDFIENLKRFLSVDDGSVSPAIEKARVRGELRSNIIPPELEVVIIDGEGIGHDAKESRLLSTRHFDYFYNCDAIILVEDGEVPFRAGGKNALAAIERNGYLSKTSLVFSRLDLAQGEEDGRQSQILEVERTLRNVLHALADENVSIERSRIDVRYLADMHKDRPDQESQQELRSLLQFIQQRYGTERARFVAPSYDFELLAGYLAQSTTTFRQAWDGYINGTSAAPWQTQKAFAKRLSRKDDEYRYLKPVAELSEILMAHMRGYLARPIHWAEDITESHQNECLEFLRVELSNELKEFIRFEVTEEQNPNWEQAANLSGRYSTLPRRRLIMEIIESSAPDLTGADARAFKDEIKTLIENAIRKCSSRAP